MARQPWSVWSLSPDRKHWMEVGQDFPQDEAEADVARKLARATKYGMDVQFVALPAGERPGPEHIKPAAEPAKPDRYAVLVFKVGDDTDFDTVEQVVAQMVPPGDWTYERGDVVTDKHDYAGLMSGSWSP